MPILFPNHHQNVVLCGRKRALEQLSKRDFHLNVLAFLEPLVEIKLQARTIADVFRSRALCEM